MPVIDRLADVPALVGKELGVSDWMTIDQARIDAFADATGDHQWIHVDLERAAAEMPTGTTIAHGYLILSLVPLLASPLLEVRDVARTLNYGCNKVRYTAMVPTGARIRARRKLLSAEPGSGGLRLVSEITFEIEGSERPACVAEIVTVMYAD